MASIGAQAARNERIMEDDQGRSPSRKGDDEDGSHSDLETRFGLTNNGKPRFWTRRKIMVAVGASVLLLGLTLGLALGLTIGRPKNDDSGAVVPSPTATGGSPQPPATMWQPTVGTTWQIILSQKLKIDGNSPSVTPDVAVYDIDLYENTNQATSPATIDALHKAGKKVICYFSAGTYEDWRKDKALWQPSDMGDNLDEWPGERWANLRSDNVAKIIRGRIQEAAKMGCDAIDPDNTDAYNNDGGGLGLTKTDTINFVKNVIVDEAKKYKMAVGLKNSGDVAKQLEPFIQFSVVEQCSEYNECKVYQDAFIAANKPVFLIEYPNGISEATGLSNRDAICVKDGSGADMSKFSTVIKKMNLDNWVQFCSGDVAKTSVN